MQQFIFLTITGLSTAAVFAIAASGLVLTYTTTGVFNFAHGAVGMLGAFMFWQLHEHWGLPSWLALVLVLGVIAPAFGAILERGIMRGLQGTADATQLVVSVSLLAATIAIAQLFWSPQEAHPVEHFWEGSTVAILGVRVTLHAVFAFAIAIAVALGLRVLLYRTRAGMTMRASVDDRHLAMLNGARPDRSSMLAWAIGCSLAALAGILIAPEQGLQHLVLALLIVNAYAAALIGRLRSLPLTFLGAVILGLADAYATGYLPKSSDTGIPGQLAPYLSGFRPAMPIIILFVVLLLLPQSKLRGHSAARARERFPMPTWGGSLLAAVLLLGAVAIISSLVTDADALQLSKVFGFAIIALSLVPLVGYAGHISLCQMSFAGIGAIVMSHHGAGGSPVGLVYAAVICAIVGAIVALPALRLSGLYLALATGAFAVILDRWIFTLPAFDIGPIHIDLFGALSLPVDRLHIPGVDPSSEKAYLVVVAAVFAVMALGVVALRRARYGDRFLALKDSPAACATLGMNHTATKLGVFALSAAMAGIGGAIYAGSLGTVSPERFSFFESLPLLLLAVVGGIGSAGGAVFAGIVLFGIPIVASTWATLDIAVQSLPGAGDLSDLLKVTPGLMGIGLARNPNGVVPDLASRFEVVRSKRSVLAGLGVVLASLVAAAELEVLGGWWFGTLAVVAIFATIPISEAIERKRAGAIVVEEVPLEWLGVVEPYTEADVRRIDEGLHLPDVVPA